MNIKCMINGNEIPSIFANHFATVLAGFRETRTGTINPVTKEARLESLRALDQAEALKKAVSENPNLPIEIEIPDTCKIQLQSGDLFRAAEKAFNLVVASQEISDLRKELKRILRFENLRPSPAGESAPESVNFDEVARLFA